MTNRVSMFVKKLFQNCLALSLIFQFLFLPAVLAANLPAPCDKPFSPLNKTDQKAIYCKSAEQADKAYKGDMITMIPYAATLAICATACAMTLNVFAAPSMPSWIKACRYTKFAAMAVDLGVTIAMAKSMGDAMKSLVGVGLMGAQMMLSFNEMPNSTKMITKNEELERDIFVIKIRQYLTLLGGVSEALSDPLPPFTDNAGTWQADENGVYNLTVPNTNGVPVDFSPWQQPAPQAAPTLPEQKLTPGSTQSDGVSYAEDGYGIPRTSDHQTRDEFINAHGEEPMGGVGITSSQGESTPPAAAPFNQANGPTSDYSTGTGAASNTGVDTTGTSQNEHENYGVAPSGNELTTPSSTAQTQTVGPVADAEPTYVGSEGASRDMGNRPPETQSGGTGGTPAVTAQAGGAVAAKATGKTANGASKKDKVDTCFTAAIAALTVTSKVMAMNSAKKSKDDNIKSAQQLEDAATPAAPPSPTTYNVDSIISTKAATTQYVSPDTCVSYKASGDSRGMMSCISKSDPFVGEMLKNPEFSNTFRTLSGRSMDQWVKELPENVTADKMVASAMAGTGKMSSIQPRVGQMLQSFTTAIEKSGFAKSSTNNRPALTKNQSVSNTNVGQPSQPTLGMGKQVTNVTANRVVARSPDSYNPESIARAKALNIFTRVSYRYKVMRLRVTPKPYELPFNKQSSER